MAQGGFAAFLVASSVLLRFVPHPWNFSPVIGAALFFLVSNFGVWVVGHDEGWYPPTLQGLMACWAAGIPFYRNSLVGDLLYTGILFGTYELFARGTFIRSHGGGARRASEAEVRNETRLAGARRAAHRRAPRPGDL